MHMKRQKKLLPLYAAVILGTTLHPLCSLAQTSKDLLMRDSLLTALAQGDIDSSAHIAVRLVRSIAPECEKDLEKWCQAWEKSMSDQASETGRRPDPDGLDVAWLQSQASNLSPLPDLEGVTDKVNTVYTLAGWCQTMRPVLNDKGLRYRQDEMMSILLFKVLDRMKDELPWAIRVEIIRRGMRDFGAKHGSERLRGLLFQILYLEEQNEGRCSADILMRIGKLYIDVEKAATAEPFLERAVQAARKELRTDESSLNGYWQQNRRRALRWMCDSLPALCWRAKGILHYPAMGYDGLLLAHAIENGQEEALAQDCHWTDVQQQLKENECAVEMTTMRMNIDSMACLAFLVKPGMRVPVIAATRVVADKDIDLVAPEIWESLEKHLPQGGVAYVAVRGLKKPVKPRRKALLHACRITAVPSTGR